MVLIELAVSLHAAETQLAVLLWSSVCSHSRLVSSAHLHTGLLGQVLKWWNASSSYGSLTPRSWAPPPMRCPFLSSFTVSFSSSLANSLLSSPFGNLLELIESQWCENMALWPREHERVHKFCSLSVPLCNSRNIYEDILEQNTAGNHVRVWSPLIYPFLIQLLLLRIVQLCPFKPLSIFKKKIQLVVVVVVTSSSVIRLFLGWCKKWENRKEKKGFKRQMLDKRGGVGRIWAWNNWGTHKYNY